MDIDRIGPGEDFVEVIEKTCESCDVLLAVVGRSWASVVDKDGNRRLDDPGDFVRLEIVHAMEKRIRVVPVLVDGAQMPDAKVLPPDLKKFALRNAWEVSDKRFHQDVSQLIEALQKTQPVQRPGHSPSEIEPPHPVKTDTRRQEQQRRLITKKSIYAGVSAAVVLIMALVTISNWIKSSPQKPTTETQLSDKASNEDATSRVPAAHPRNTPNGPQSRPKLGPAYDVPLLQANVMAPLLFFVFEPRRTMPPPGQRPYASVFRSGLTTGKSIFWEVALNFGGQFPPPNYQIESIWYRNSKEVFRGVGTFKGSEVYTRAFHNRYSWTPPEGYLPVGQYRVDLYVDGRRVTSGQYEVQP